MEPNQTIFHRSKKEGYAAASSLTESRVSNKVTPTFSHLPINRQMLSTILPLIANRFYR